MLASLGGVTLIGAPIWIVLSNSTLFLNSRLDRLDESNLPLVSIEDENVVYCRMKADDFRFEIPTGGVATKASIESEGFESVDGSVVVTFPEERQISTRQYGELLRKNLQVGGRVSVTDHPDSGGILVDFSYFGDK